MSSVNYYETHREITHMFALCAVQFAIHSTAKNTWSVDLYIPDEAGYDQHIGHISYMLSSTDDTSFVMPTEIVTRSATQIEANTGHILSLSVSPQHQGNGYASMLLMSAICHIKVNIPSVKYITTDDVSDFSRSTRKNIYSRFRFVSIDLVGADSTDESRYTMCGPEKQLNTETEAWIKAVPAIMGELRDHTV